MTDTFVFPAGDVQARSRLAGDLCDALAALPGGEFVATSREHADGRMLARQVPAGRWPDMLVGDLAFNHRDLTVRVGERRADMHGGWFDAVVAADAAYGLFHGLPGFEDGELLRICAAAADGPVDLAAQVRAAEQAAPNLDRDSSWLPMLAALSLDDPTAVATLRRLQQPAVQAALNPEGGGRRTHRPGELFAVLAEPDHLRLLDTYNQVGAFPSCSRLLPVFLRAVADEPELAGTALSALSALTGGGARPPTGDDVWAAAAAARAIR